MNPFIDMSGHVIGQLTVISKAESQNGAMWLCECTCGNKKIVGGQGLRKGTSRSCGCLQRKLVSQKNTRNITGLRFGRLIALEKIEEKATNGCLIYLCLCDCGNYIKVAGNVLRRGDCVSCGCYGKERQKEVCTKHGHTINKSPTKTYRAWIAMIHRCYKSKVGTNEYAYYRERGIKVCDRWKHSFENFLSDMGESPLGSSIDRINNNGNYEPGNCRWTTRIVQQRNTRINFLIEWDGKKLTPMAWQEITGISAITIRGRINKGWSPEQALTTEPKK